MTDETVPQEVADHIIGIVNGQKQTANQLNNINKCLNDIAKQQDEDLKALEDAFGKLKTFNDTLTAANNSLDELNRATNSHHETQNQMESLMSDVNAAQTSTCDLYAQIRDNATKQKSVVDQCIEESFSGTVKLLQKQQSLGDTFNQICDTLEKERQIFETLINSFKDALNAFPADLHKVYGK